MSQKLCNICLVQEVLSWLSEPFIVLSDKLVSNLVESWA
jgi:hypothetical protein